jgi:hypothetical protein
MYMKKDVLEFLGVTICLLIFMVAMFFVIYRGLETSQEIVLGDINNDNRIDEEDVYYVKGHILRKWELTKEEQYRADINQDGKIDSLDVALIRAKIVEIKGD